MEAVRDQGDGFKVAQISLVSEQQPGWFQVPGSGSLTLLPNISVS